MSLTADSRLQSLVRASFQCEINALKPGNVHRYAAGHDMTVADFEHSAEICSPILCDRGLSFGERVYHCVDATMQQVGCNTNLGMILLFAPLVIAAQRLPENDSIETGLRQQLSEVINTASLKDAEWVYRAISRANPGGLGRSEHYDVADRPSVPLLVAMDAAKHRDRIALQYCQQFEDIFEQGLVWIQQSIRRWNNLDAAVVLCYLNFLCRYRDSHITRKFGEQCADTIKTKSQELARLYREQAEPDMRRQLLEFDTELKAAGINPGTTADLTAASVLVYFLVENGL